MTKRFFLAAALVLFTAPALAADTFTEDTTIPSFRARVAKLAWDSGTESAPAQNAVLGLDLTGIGGFNVHVECAAAMTAGGKFLAYLQNPVNGKWLPVSSGELDLVAANVQNQAFVGFAVASTAGRIAYVPSGVGQACTIYVVGTYR